jgi:hypothetical protein
VRPDRVCLRGATEESSEYSSALGVLAPKSFAKSLKTAQLLLFKCGRLAFLRMHIGAFRSVWAFVSALNRVFWVPFLALVGGLISHSSYPCRRPWHRHASCIGPIECRPKWD